MRESTIACIGRNVGQFLLLVPSDVRLATTRPSSRRPLLLKSEGEPDWQSLALWERDIGEG